MMRCFKDSSYYSCTVNGRVKHRRSFASLGSLFKTRFHLPRNGDNSTSIAYYYSSTASQHHRQQHLIFHPSFQEIMYLSAFILAAALAAGAAARPVTLSQSSSPTPQG